MTRPPVRLSTLSFALLLASCSDSNDSVRDGGSPGSQEAGTNRDDAGGAGDEDAGGDEGVDASSPGNDAGRSDAGRTDAGGGGNDASTGNEAGAGNDAGPITTACNASAAPDVGKLGLESVISGMSELVFAIQAPGSNDWYLLQQTGEILLRAAGATTNSMFLDVSGEVNLRDGIGDDERGLLGMAFAPDYATSGIFYVMMTPTGTNVDQVRQYQRMGSGAPMLTETVLTLPASAANHNGGHLVMHEGLLYVGTGDGGGSCNSDKPGTPQQINAEPSSWFGKILRLDPARKANAYAAEGNPFPESPLVYHYGLRNPFRFGFDRGTGDLYIGDVGQNAYEEVHYAKAGVKGLNYGWAAFESETNTCTGRALRAGSTHTKPIFAANRRQGSCTGSFCDWISVIGGVVYRGTAVPKLSGAYLTGDYVGVRMVAFYQCDTTTSPQTLIRKQCDPNAPNEACFQGGALESLVAIVEDNAGEVYFVANRNSLVKVVAR